MSVKRKYIVAVEDNQDHQLLLARAINKSITSPDILMLNDGAELLEWLRLGQVRAPDLIILDLKMPKINGFEVLRTLKSTSLKTVPVLVMSTSLLKSDIRKAYELGCASYISKSENIMRWSSLVLETVNYWLNCNKTLESVGLH